VYYLYPPEAGWLPILVASYDTHGLQRDYSYSPVTTRGNYFHSASVYLDRREVQQNGVSSIMKKPCFAVWSLTFSIRTKLDRLFPSDFFVSLFNYYFIPSSL
jgi:hypothetical protein